MKKKEIVESIIKKYYLILSVLIFVILLFPKLFGAKFFTAIDMFYFIFNNGPIIGAPSPIAILIAFLIVLFLNTLAIIGILSKFNKKKEVKFEHWIYLINSFFVMFLGLAFLGEYFGTLEGEFSNLFLKYLGYNLWFYLIVSFGYFISILILLIWQSIFIGKKEFREQLEKEGWGRAIPSKYKSNTISFIVYILALFIGISIGGILPILFCLIISFFIIKFLKRIKFL